MEYVAAIVVVFIIIVAAFFLMRSRRAKPSTLELRPEDKAVLQFMAEKGGKVLESELRQKFPIPRSSLWRLAKRLERMGFVRITKVGIQNEIELVRKGEWT